MSGPRAGTAGTAAWQRRGNEQKKGVRRQQLTFIKMEN